MLQMFVLALSLYNTWNRGVFLLCKITNLLIYRSYILGACTIVIFLPIVEEIVNVILSWIEYLKILPGKLVIKGNAELQELQSDFEVESTDTCAIGFHYEPETEEYYDEEE